MAMTDQEYRRHLKTWLAFGRLMRWVVGLIIIVLVLMAYFLL
ncbi:MAG TPA: aa3-type cytochrome c oxidase subunit IV [Stellaceae bacterium]|nr:aa3-type cytochrome c oxidase subunit IV [Stellaceae bacterium]